MRPPRASVGDELTHDTVALVEQEHPPFRTRRDLHVRARRGLPALRLVLRLDQLQESPLRTAVPEEDPANGSLSAAGKIVRRYGEDLAAGEVPEDHHVGERRDGGPAIDEH